VNGIVIGVLSYLGLRTPGWPVFIGLGAFFGTTIPINLWLKKRLEALFGRVQTAIEESQGALRRKINLLQSKMAGGGKGLQKQLEKEQAESIHAALAMLDSIRPYYKWSVMAERQANTVRAQLHYQIQEFEQADACFKKCLIMDPLTLAMKTARSYEQGDIEAVEKACRKGVKRYKDEKGVILYALHSWVLVKVNRVEDAIKLLAKAKDETENATLKANWEHLANGRVRHFSNAGLGDQWYALHMEVPKPVKVKQRALGGRFR
jgi:tetratricopeptide (TPR) repeat protein